jgi:cholesterol transport system auxiliary component
MIRLLSAVLGALSLAACVGSLLESDAPPDRVYTIQPAAAADDAASPLDVRIAVGRPRVAPGLGSDRIAVLQDGRSLTFYQGARWGDTAPEVVQSFLVESLRKSGEFVIVTSADAPISATHLLDLELRDFQAEYADGGRPSAKVAVVVTLIDLADRRAMLAFESAAEADARVERLAAVVDAIEAATNQVAHEISARVADSIRSASAAAQ